MTVSELLSELTRIIFVLLTIMTFVDFVRHRGKVRRDVALVFLCISASLIIGIFRELIAIEAPFLTTIGQIALLAQPFLLLRLVRYFRPIPEIYYRSAIAGMLISWVVVILFDTPLPAPAVLALIAYFVVVDGYAVLAFVRGAFSSAGVTRKRLQFAAAGSGLLVLALFMVGIRTAFPDLTPFVLPTTQFLAILCALAYYLSFAPPRWLRQAWQLTELKNYLQRVAEATDKTVVGILDQLHLTIERAMSTDKIAVFLWDETSKALIPGSPKNAPLMSTLHTSAPAQHAWRKQEPVIAYCSPSLGSVDVHLNAAENDGTVLIVPVATTSRNLGLLMVFLEYGSLFGDDDLRLLAIFAQQTATMLENYAVLDQLRHHAEELEHKVQERTAALQRSNEDLQHFAYIASHDLQEPLRTVTSYLQLIEKRYTDKLDQDGHEFIGFAVDAASRMQVLIRDLLTYSRVETQKNDFTQVDLQHTVKQACDLLETAIQETDAQITIEPLPTIMGDDRLMVTLFQNLISNALKYRNQQRPEIHIGAARNSVHWQFSVKDNGIGIEPQHLERIFVIFKRLHHSDEYPGTGIGLAVCKRVVEQHGGRIWAESELGKGTTFYFTIRA